MQLQPLALDDLEYDKTICAQLSDIINEEYPDVHIKVWEKEEELKRSIMEGSIYKILFLSLEKNLVLCQDLAQVKMRDFSF